MKILFINNDGGGFADHIDVAEGRPFRPCSHSGSRPPGPRTI